MLGILYRSRFQTAATSSIKRVARCRYFSTQRPSYPKKPIVAWCIVASGITYSVMATQQTNALLEQKQALSGTSPEAYEKAKAEQDNLAAVKAARDSPDYFEIEAYGHLRGAAKLQSLTASVNGLLTKQQRRSTQSN